MTEPEWLEEFGKSLAYSIMNAGTTQRELAKVTGLTEGTISKYVTGRQMPSARAIINISYALDCTTDSLIDFGDTIE